MCRYKLNFPPRKINHNLKVAEDKIDNRYVVNKKILFI